MISVVCTFTAVSVRAEETAALLLPHHCAGDCPTVRMGNVVVVRSIYTASANPRTKFADWVAYTVRPDQLGDACGAERERDWQETLPDALVMEDADYENAPPSFGYHRGHLAPLETFACDPDWAQANDMVNISPHRGGVNSGAWRRLEGGVRQAVGSGGFAMLGVITGNIYTGDPVPPLNTDEPHVVPTELFKLVVAEAADGLAILGFRIPQRYRTGIGPTYQRCLASVAELEAATGLTLLPSLTPAAIAAAEARGGQIHTAMGFDAPFEDAECTVDPTL
jgi:endonuclease G